MADDPERNRARLARISRQKARETAAENANFLLEWQWARARGEPFLMWEGVRYSTYVGPGSLGAPKPVHGWDAILAQLGTDDAED